LIALEISATIEHYQKMWYLMEYIMIIIMDAAAWIQPGYAGCYNCYGKDVVCLFFAMRIPVLKVKRKSFN